jgi:hypothetical protein
LFGGVVEGRGSSEEDGFLRGVRIEESRRRRRRRRR